MNFNVEIAYNDRVFETLLIEADDASDAEFVAMNIVRDTNPDAHNVEVLEVNAA